MWHPHLTILQGKVKVTGEGGEEGKGERGKGKGKSDGEMNCIHLTNEM